jgi:hypothetical protein
MTPYLERYEQVVARGLITEQELFQLARVDIAYERAGIA